MAYKIIYFFVEGPDDLRFFENIIYTILEKKCNLIKIITYAGMKGEKIENYIKSIKSMNHSNNELKTEYFFISDIDCQPCVTKKKSFLKAQYNNIDVSKIIVVIKEIESWYLAGLKNKNLEKFNIGNLRETNSINKEDFDRRIPKQFDLKRDFLIEILKVFSVSEAKRKNNSFKYFLNYIFNVVL